MRPLLAEWMLPWLRRQGLRDITDEQMLVAIHTPSAVSAAVQQVLTDSPEPEPSPEPSP